MLPVGTRVVVSGLQSQPHYNGMRGRVVRTPVGAAAQPQGSVGVERVSVELENSGSVIAVRSTNLTICPPESSDGAGAGPPASDASFISQLAQPGAAVSNAAGPGTLLTRVVRERNWFHSVFGFHEPDYDATKGQFLWEEPYLTSMANGRRFHAGAFTTPSVAQLRQRALAAWQASGLPRRPITLARVSIGDVLTMHADPANAGATFQAASQFNCLEFVSSSVVPEMGVTRYEWDATQGPACAIACGPGTVVRNYFAVVRGANELGQRTERQINTMAALDDTPVGPLFTVMNGYTSSTSERLRQLPEAIASVGRDDLVAMVRVGVQADTEVVFQKRGVVCATPCPRVTQVYCSAVSCSYSGLPASEWEPLATIALDACYEATLWAALENSMRNRESAAANVVWLTKVGGGVFGNPEHWINAAIHRAVAALPQDCGLDVRVGEYSRY